MSVLRRGDNYYIDYYDPWGKRVRKAIGPSRRQADVVLKKIKVQIAEGKYLEVHRIKNIKFEEIVNDYLELYAKPNKNSWISDYYNLKALAAFFKGKFISRIKPQDIEGYKMHRKQEVSASTVNRELATLKTMFAKAVEWGKLKSNPAKKIKPFKENKARLRYLEKEEIERLISACSDSLRPIVILAIFTGMRRGEILNLKWADTDFKKDVIYLENTKNGENREVFMSAIVKNALIRIPKHQSSPYLFYTRKSKHRKTVKAAFKEALQKAGIDNFHFHDLRHTFGSQLSMRGCDLNTIRDLMGHKSVKMTLRYAHLSPTHKRRAVDTLCKQIGTNWSHRPKAAAAEEKPALKSLENINKN